MTAEYRMGCILTAAAGLAMLGLGYLTNLGPSLAVGTLAWLVVYDAVQLKRGR